VQREDNKRENGKAKITRHSPADDDDDVMCFQKPLETFVPGYIGSFDNNYRSKLCIHIYTHIYTCTVLRVNYKNTRMYRGLHLEGGARGRSTHYRWASFTYYDSLALSQRRSESRNTIKCMIHSLMTGLGTAVPETPPTLPTTTATTVQEDPPSGRPVPPTPWPAPLPRHTGSVELRVVSDIAAGLSWHRHGPGPS
jgi:hypothetical protein